MVSRSRSLVVGDSRERLLKVAAAIAVAGFVLGLAYRQIFDDPGERSLENYLRSGVHGMSLAATGWAAHIYFNARGAGWLRRGPLLLEIALRAMVMAAAISLVAMILQVILYDQPLALDWVADELPRVVAISLAFSAIFGAAFELTRLVGARVLVNVFLGRYRHPRREERALMFLDLAGSTALAEALGEVRMQELLSRFFFDIDAPILAHGGEVHAYVGDEVIVTWPLAAAAADGSCLRCFFAIADRIGAVADSYRDEFGAVPRFRAALHAGPVVIGECGNSRRQIAYFGDTLNVTERIQEHCKRVGRPLLVSADLLRRVRPGPDLRLEPLGPVELRGRAAPVELYSVERRLSREVA